MKLISWEDLTFGRTGLGPKLLAKATMGIFGINNINLLYSGTYHSGDRCAAHLLAALNTTYEVLGKDLTNIPQEGGVIFVSNHPTGGLDGVLLIDMLASIRPDIKFLGNFILQRIESLGQYFIPVNPFPDHDPRENVRGVRRAAEHLKAGGALAVFPAAEVSSWSKETRLIQDTQWRRAVMRMIQRASLPVVPIRIEARNSIKFYVLGAIHPFLKMAMLPREFCNKRNMVVPVAVGETIWPQDTANIKDVPIYADFVRGKVDELHDRFLARTTKHGGM